MHQRGELMSSRDNRDLIPCTAVLMPPIFLAQSCLGPAVSRMPYLVAWWEGVCSIREGITLQAFIAITSRQIHLHMAWGAYSFLDKALPCVTRLEPEEVHLPMDYCSIGLLYQPQHGRRSLATISDEGTWHSTWWREEGGWWLLRESLQYELAGRLEPSWRKLFKGGFVGTNEPFLDSWLSADYGVIRLVGSMGGGRLVGAVVGPGAGAAGCVEVIVINREMAHAAVLTWWTAWGGRSIFTTAQFGRKARNTTVLGLYTGIAFTDTGSVAPTTRLVLAFNPKNLHCITPVCEIMFRWNGNFI